MKIMARSGENGAGADRSALPSAVRGTPSVGRFFHCASAGMGSHAAATQAAIVVPTSWRNEMVMG
jgi:hypothetical protein